MIRPRIHSGACDGADLTWEIEGNKYGLTTVAYSYSGHTRYISNGDTTEVYVMTPEELLEGWKHVKIADETLKRNLSKIEYNPYVRNLLCRDWFQVKHSDAIFAVGYLEGKSKVEGGTGWAVQMGIDNNKLIYLFSQKDDTWYIYNYGAKQFLKYYDVPDINVDNFAGIGSRRLLDSGKKAIQEILKKNYGND